MAIYQYSEDSLRNHLLNLYKISCRVGGLDCGVRLNEAGEAAANYIYENLQQAGLSSVGRQIFTTARWWPEEYSLCIKEGDGEKPLMAFPLWYTEGIDNTILEVVDVGYGTAGELRGKKIKGKAALLHMKRIFHFIQTFEKTNALEKLIKQGAAAVIVMDELLDAPGGMLAVSHKEVMKSGGKVAPMLPLPCFSIGKSEGQELLRRMAAGKTAVKAHLKVSVRDAEACNVIGELPGNGESDEVIVIGGHYDTWFGGALDNLASQGGLIELARHFASVPLEERPRTMLFVSIFGHEFGNQGHMALAEELRSMKNRITCFYDLDGSGSTGWEVDHEGRIIETGFNDICGIVSSSNALSKLAYQALYHHNVFSIHFYDNAHIADLDGPLSELGIPTLLLISKHLFYHTPLDTPDRIPPEAVLRRMEVNRQIISELLHSAPGYYLATNTNPFREQNPQIPQQEDITIDELPVNPRPWVEGPPQDLLFEIIPEKPRVFSPVMVWRGHFVSEGIARIPDISWSFGSLLSKILPKTRTGPATGTIYLVPGTKTIRMMVRDRHGRMSSVERKIKVTW